MNKSLNLLIPLIVAAFLYDSLAIAGLGIPILLLAATLLHGIAFISGSSQPTVPLMKVPAVRTPFLIYLAFAMCFLFALLYTGSTTSEDYTYWYSLVGQALWFPAIWWITYRTRGRFDRVLDMSVMLVVSILLLFWLLGLAQTLDPFYLRNSLDHFGTLSIAPDLFSNPNRTARTLILLLMYTMYRSRSAETRLSKTWFKLSLVLSLLIFFTLSRSGIASMTILWTMLSFDPRSLKKSKIIGILCLAVAVCTLLLVPRFGDRIEQIVATVADVGNYYGSEVDATSMTLRARSWTASIQIIRDNPVFGVGVSNALNTMEFYGSVGYKGATELKVIWVHGGFLKLSVYAGLLTSFIFICLLYEIARNFVKQYKLTNTDNRSSSASASWVGLSGILASIPVNIGADFYGLGMVWVIFSFLIAKSVLTAKSPVT